MLNLNAQGRMIKVSEYDYDQNFVSSEIENCDELNDVLIHNEKQIYNENAKMLKFENAVKKMNNKNLKAFQKNEKMRAKENQILSSQVDNELNELEHYNNDACTRLAVAQGQGRYFNPDTATLGPITDYPQIVPGKPFNYNGSNMHGTNAQMGGLFDDIWSEAASAWDRSKEDLIDQGIEALANELLPGQQPPPGSTVVYQQVPAGPGVVPATGIVPRTTGAGIIPGVSNKTLMIAGGGFAGLLILIMLLKR